MTRTQSAALSKAEELVNLATRDAQQQVIDAAVQVAFAVRELRPDITLAEIRHMLNAKGFYRFASDQALIRAKERADNR